MNTILVRRLCLLAAACGWVTSASAQWCENFDTYSSGSTIAGQGGWELWCIGGSDALVSSNFARSAANSLRIGPGADVVQRIAGVNSGQWTFTFWTYYPSSASGEGWINVMNNYAAGCASGAFTNDMWSTATIFGFGLVQPWGTSGVPASLITDQWVEYRLEVNLATDTFDEFYGTEQMMFGAPWSSNVGAGGLVAIDAVDIFSDASGGVDGMYFDDISLVEAGASCPGGGGCVGDLDGDGDTDLADLGILLADFGCVPPGTCPGDLDGDGDTDLADLGILLADFGCTP